MITLKFIENPIAIESATSILPKGAAFEIATGKKNLIVAVDDEKNVFAGLLCYELYEQSGEVRIDWMEVREDYRGMGIALRLHTMLFSVCADLKWVNRILAFFPEDREEYLDMVILLKNLGYRWGNEPDEIMTFKISEVGENSLVRSSLDKVDKNVISLKTLILNNRNQLKLLKSKWADSEVNMWNIPFVKLTKEMDSDCSIFVEKEKEIKAYTLVSKNDDRVVLRNLICSKDSSRYLIQLIAKTVSEIKKKYGEEIIVETTLVNAESRKLFSKLVSSYATRHLASLELRIRRSPK